MELPYYKELRMIRFFLEESLPGFPRRCCYRTSRLVERVVPDLVQVAGDYVFHGWVVGDHGWNVDRKKGLIIDLTRDQFGSRLGGVSIFPFGVDYYKTRWSLTLLQRAITLLGFEEDVSLLRGYKDFRSRAFSRSAQAL